MRQVDEGDTIFGTLEDGGVVTAYVLRNRQGMAVRILSYGASIHSVCVPDRDGRLADVTCGYARLDDYLQKPQYFGATVGRLANRLAGARFSLSGRDYHVSANDGPHSLHGGHAGFDKVNWTLAARDARSVTLHHVSPDGDQGYPGTVTVSATYTLGDDNSLSVAYRATTDAPTLVNLSNHAYWNLTGEASGQDAMDHVLTIPADHYLPVDAGLIPTGKRRSVAGTAFDFRRPTPIGARVHDRSDPQLQHGGGYDHNWIVGETVTAAPRPVARLDDPRSGRTMTLLSNQPGLQFYSGNFFDGTTRGKGDRPYGRGAAIALEPQLFPDAAHQPSFPQALLMPGDTYANDIIWRFGVTEAQS